MAGKNFFHRGGIHIEAADECHIFLAVHNIEVAIGIHVRDIARKQPRRPAILHIAQRNIRFSRKIEVAQHHVRAAHNQFPGFTLRQVCAFVKQADDPALYIRERNSNRLVLARLAHRVTVRCGGRLTHAKAFPQWRSRKLLKAQLD